MLSLISHARVCLGIFQLNAIMFVYQSREPEPLGQCVAFDRANDLQVFAQCLPNCVSNDSTNDYPQQNRMDIRRNRTYRNDKDSHKDMDNKGATIIIREEGNALAIMSFKAFNTNW